MIVKPRTKSRLLEILEILNFRMELAEDEKQYYLALEKGYRGELLNDLWVEKLKEEMLVLHDLLFEIKNTQFQIDTLIIAQDRVYLLDVKYHEGDYIYKNDGFYTLSGKETKNHLHQLRRCETLLRQLLQTLSFNFPIESYLIFNNPEFFLYNVPPELQIIFPTQLKRFYNNLNKRPSKLSEKHKVLANKLLDENIGESCYSKLPVYKYEQLKKGFTCECCNSLLTNVDKRKVCCTKCGHIEHIESAVLRNVEEYKLLFPERKVTTIGIVEWCGGVLSIKAIRTILNKNYKIMGLGRFSYFK
ncbi:Nuclease-related domain-containing protein [Mesobacillus persicus]|uniref:Nuclease-related domain-containing protein n=1 Tax=Mesobacillus persicus TaxID=930146 RepID=A0A1H7Y129_9BACI|nr:nuclease-related domain-containing protein [Mesobacillus persicus]SEM39671.1 Nuclease-related domain-containing protein [Mesobacillus persicus]